MTQNNSEEYKFELEDIGIYRPTSLISEFAKKKDAKALEEILTNFSGNLGIREKDRTDITALLADSQNLKKVEDIFGTKYNEALYSQKISDLRDYYSQYFGDYFTEDNLSNVNEGFKSDETYGEIMRRYHNAGLKTQLEGEDQKDTKEKSIEEYKRLAKIVIPLKRFEEFELNNIREPANKESIKKELNSLYEEGKK